MQLLREMLLLVEDYGNLKAISPKFLKELKKTANRALYPGLGKDSVVDDEPFTGQTNFNNKITQSANTITAALVYRKSDGEQIGFIMDIADTQFRSTRYMMVMYDQGFISPSDSKIGDVTVSTERKESKDIVNFIKTCSSSPLIKDPRKELGVKFIYNDKNRIDARRDRYKRKEGIVPIKMSPEELEKYTAKAAKDLEERLKEFKRGKRTVPMKDLIPEIMEKGYLNSIVVDGYEYEFAQSTVNFDAERDENNWMHGKSEIRYEIVDSPKYKKVQYAFWDAINEISGLRDDDEAYEREKTKLRKRFKLPPSNIYFKLGFKGAALVPVDLRLDFRA